MVGTALQSALALNINACLIHWHPWDLPLTSESDLSLLVAISAGDEMWDVIPLLCYSPGAQGGCEATGEMMVCGEMSLLSSRIKCCLEYTSGLPLSIKWKYLMVFIIFGLQKSQHKRCRYKTNTLGDFSFFCGWRKVLFPGHLMKME